MALEAVVDFLNADIFLIRTKKSIEKSAAKEALISREKTVLRAGALKESKLSLSYMAHRTLDFAHFKPRNIPRQQDGQDLIASCVLIDNTVLHQDASLVIQFCPLERNLV